MRVFTIYALDRNGAVVFTQSTRLAQFAEAKKLADTLLLQYPKVEVWEGPVCVLRSDGSKLRQ